MCSDTAPFKTQKNVAVFDVQEIFAGAENSPLGRVWLE